MSRKNFDIPTSYVVERVRIPRGRRNFYNKPQTFKKKKNVDIKKVRKRKKKYKSTKSWKNWPIPRKDPFAEWTKRRDDADPLRFARFSRGMVENMESKNASATDLAFLAGSKRKAVARSNALKKQLNQTEGSWMPGMPEVNHNAWYQTIKNTEREYRYWINTVRNIARDIAVLRSFLN